MPRTRHPWPPEDIALLRAEYGHTPTRELAARIGVTPGAINQRAKKLGYPDFRVEIKQPCCIATGRIDQCNTC